MAHFVLTTEWTLSAPRDRVWDYVLRPHRLADWWPGFERSELIRGQGGVGSVIDCRVQGRWWLCFDFIMTIESIMERKRIEVTAQGDFVGKGTWTFCEDNGHTRVTYRWDVSVHGLLPRTLSRIPGMRSLLVRGHDEVMQAGGQALERLLSTP